MPKPIPFAILACFMAGAAFAQDATPPPPAQGQTGASPSTFPDGPPRGPGRPEARGPGGPGGEGRRGPPRPRPMEQAAAKGFVLDLGRHRSLRVNCGDETMSECLQAVRPVIDQLPSLTGGN
ncbi:hypothetical protein LX81_00861 [Palleronia aestuarii]|uniref:Uncharacterized protein n=1 Tax=Palleronia aestuarii TaxID=568105 RepID=A0A2W7P4A1_9RHOB|nr:hypothetical protein [Palleronia aestuarii]PZX18232.1 hypothetical protein LX81_00861 [Palleronia aestuarii]